MPQMSPMMWMTILVLTTMLMLVMISVNYFSYMKNIKSKNNFKKKSLDWKW